MPTHNFPGDLRCPSCGHSSFRGEEILRYYTLIECVYCRSMCRVDQAEKAGRRLASFGRALLEQGARKT